MVKKTAEGNEEKPKYERPQLIDLGELARAASALCSPGNNPSGQGQGACGVGGAAIGQCNVGMNVKTG